VSNDQAIAAVTVTLRSVLDREFNAPILLPDDPDLTGTRVSARPLDRARDGFAGNQLNLFLYQTSINAALRNTDAPVRMRTDERGFPPLALDLHYLLTAYGRDSQDPEIFAHRLLGRAMSVLHDTPVLTPGQLRAATAIDLPESDLHDQIEYIRITPQPLSLEELTRLWATFQTEYRVSAIYQVEVVLIESNRRARPSLPVLRRGEQDRGPEVVGDVVLPYPTVERIGRLVRRPGFQLGDTIVLIGHHLAGSNPVAIVTHMRLDAVNEVVPEPANSATEIRVRLPRPPGPVPTLDDDPSAAERWPAGIHTISLRYERQDVGEQLSREQFSNAMPLALLPRINLPADPVRRDGDQVFVRVTVVPQVWPGQEVALLIGDREIQAGRVEARTDDFEFDVTGIPTGTHLVRLRVDGVDSVPVVEAGDPPRLLFDDSQKVTIA
jgi:hypothetical protein